MQYREIILSTFRRKGYTEQTPITFKQFRLVMDQITDEHKASKNAIQSLLNEIWKETQNRITRSSQNHSRQVSTLQLVESIEAAIDILSNRISQCSKSINDLKSKQKQLLKEENFVKLQVLQHKLQTLEKDNSQFQKDLRLITNPFINENDRHEDLTNHKDNKNHRKGSVSRSAAGSIGKVSIDDEFEITRQRAFLNNQYQQLSQYMKQNQGKGIDPEEAEDERKIALWMLGLMLFLEATVMIVKFCFVNLIVLLLGFFVLLQPYKQNMVKIGYYSCMFTLPIDFLWFLLYSSFYLSSQSNTNLIHITKPYSQYIWFASVVQPFIKILYLFVMNRYQFHKVVISQQVQKQEIQRQLEQKEQQNKMAPKTLNDNYIPDMKQFVNLEAIKNSTK